MFAGGTTMIPAARDSGTDRVTPFRRRCLLLQGFVGVEDATLVRLNFPLRFTPALCLTLTATAVALGTALVLGALSVMAAAAATGRRHPFDLLWEHVVRPAVNGPRLPSAPAPRRFAFAMAACVLAAATLSFAAGASTLGVAFGLLQVAGCAVYVTTGWCAGSFLHQVLVRPAPSAGASAT